MGGVCCHSEAYDANVGLDPLDDEQDDREVAHQAVEHVHRTLVCDRSTEPQADPSSRLSEYPHAAALFFRCGVGHSNMREAVAGKVVAQAWGGTCSAQKPSSLHKPLCVNLRTHSKSQQRTSPMAHSQCPTVSSGGGA